MISKIFGAVFAPKHPRGYTGRHRAVAVPTSVTNPHVNRATAVTPAEVTA